MVTVLYERESFVVYGQGNLERRFNIFRFNSIIEEISCIIINSVKKPGKPYKWIQIKIAKALAKRISLHLREIISTLPKDVVEVSKRLFNVNLTKAKSPQEIVLDKKAINQIKKYRGAAYAYNKYTFLKHNWMNIFGKLDKNKKETVKNLPGNLSIAIVEDRLRNIQIDRPIFDRSELLIKLLSDFAGNNTHLVFKASKEEFKKAMKIYDSNLSIRKTKDITCFIASISNFKHEVNNLVDLVILEKEINVKNN